MIKIYLFFLILLNDISLADAIDMFHLKLEKQNITYLKNLTDMHTKYSLNTSLGNNILDSSILNVDKLMLLENLNEDQRLFLQKSETYTKELIKEKKTINCYNISTKFVDFTDENKNKMEDICNDFNENIKNINQISSYSVKMTKNSFIYKYINKNQDILKYELLNNYNTYNNTKLQIILENKLLNKISSSFSEENLYDISSRLTDTNASSFYSYSNLLNVFNTRVDYLKKLPPLDTSILSNVQNNINNYVFNSYNNELTFFDNNTIGDINDTNISQNEMISSFIDLYHEACSNDLVFSNIRSFTDDICVLNIDGIFEKVKLQDVYNNKYDYIIVDLTYDPSSSNNTLKELNTTSYDYGALSTKKGDIKTSNNSFISLDASSSYYNFVPTDNTYKKFISVKLYEDKIAKIILDCVINPFCQQSSIQNDIKIYQDVLDSLKDGI